MQLFESETMLHYPLSQFESDFCGDLLDGAFAELSMLGTPYHLVGVVFHAGQHCVLVHSQADHQGGNIKGSAVGAMV